jgi:quinohemoprotein ethanol dehydrogenase
MVSKNRAASLWSASVATALILSVLAMARGRADSLGSGTAGENWEGYGRIYDEAHFSPLTDINTSNAARLGLAWWFDIPGVALATSVPLEVGGTLYVATGYSVVRALDATTGRLLWTFDPKVPQVAGHKLRASWGIRGIAYREQKIYVGTHDGRLIAIDAKAGTPLWSVTTVDRDDLRFISGPPLVFKNMVVIGHGGSDLGAVRGYVTAYEATTGRQLWRFYTVPGDPAKGFEDEAMKMAAKTWHGRWWEKGGGGTVWNAMTYDPVFDRVYIGTGNGSPWNQKIRSPGGGDNLFIDSIVALDADTGAYVWHYQVNPGEVWDYDAATDIELADLTIAGKRRSVLMQASKNGFFYVLDRNDGKLISADKFAKVTWAKKIDLHTGRPVEAVNARYQSGDVTIWPSPGGAHASQPMAFNPIAGLVFIPTLDLPGTYDDRGIDLHAWKPNTNFVPSVGINSGGGDMPANAGTSSLLAWDPVRQKVRWRAALPGIWNGGAATTAGGLVFQGRCDGKFVAYSADSGESLWSFDAQTGIVGAAITYSVDHRQYVTVIAGFGGPGSTLGSMAAQFGWSARTQPRRVLAFEIDGKAQLPSREVGTAPVVPMSDPEFVTDEVSEASGARKFAERCANCHGSAAIAGGAAPDLRASGVVLSTDAFAAVVKDGMFLERGMPRFEELSAQDLQEIRQYLRSRAHADTQKATARGSLRKVCLRTFSGVCGQ